MVSWIGAILCMYANSCTVPCHNVSPLVKLGSLRHNCHCRTDSVCMTSTEEFDNEFTHSFLFKVFTLFAQTRLFHRLYFLNISLFTCKALLDNISFAKAIGISLSFLVCHFSADLWQLLMAVSCLCTCIPLPRIWDGNWI